MAMRGDKLFCNAGPSGGGMRKITRCLEAASHGFDRKVDGEFMLVNCNNTEYFLSHPIRNENLVKKQKALIKKKRPISIIGIGFDSMSHANYIRSIPQTLEFLSSSLNKTGNLFSLNGYNIVGDGTTQNLAGILTGIGETDLPEARKGVPNARMVDNWPWLWKNASAAGYVTSYLEDETQLGAFTIRLKGFSNTPTDHSLAQFWRGLWLHSSNPCHTGMWDWARQLEYLLDLLDKYSDVPVFFFAFSKITHVQCLSELRRFDGLLRNYMEELFRKKNFENTLFFLFGDHGARYGSFRKTIQGKIEERLPGMFIKIPDWLSAQQPEIAENLRNNQNRLTTPYDLHATLWHAIEYPSIPSFYPHQKSLFTPISPLRRCEHAKIDSHWCTCKTKTLIDIDRTVVRGGELLVEELNSRIEADGAGKCAKLTLLNVLQAEASRYSQEMVTFVMSADKDGRRPKYGEGLRVEYEIQFEVFPGGGILEGDFVVENGTQIRIGKHFSRVNAYGEQKCDPVPHIREFCACI